MPYAFNDKGVAEELKRMANERRGTTNHPRTATGNEVILVKAPAEGIAGISGSTITSGDCTKVYIDMTGVDPVTAEDVNVELTVLNTTNEDIAGNAIFQAARLGSLWVSVAGGGGGGAQEMRTIVAYSAITAATWPSGTAGTGTGDIHELSVDGGGWSSIGGSPVDVRNPFQETIELGSVMVCYKEGDYYVVIQASCPTV